MAATQTTEEEKQFVAHFSDMQHPLPPAEIQQDKRNKALGGSSRGLSVRDFELVRTLGTGALRFPADSSMSCCYARNRKLHAY